MGGRSHGSAVITLFLTNLRLLDFDLLPDWPGITVTSLGNQDARARIRSTEFALYHFFRLYDQATTADKLQPFYPPLEPLQSINLRAALYRCLNELKKNGVLGKETVLRKTMLDECQGDRFWELCLGFSALVLRKVTLEKKHTYARHRHGPPIAERLGTASTVSKGQAESLLPLAIAHKAALGRLLKEKREKRETFGRLYDVLAEKDAELVDRKARVQEQARLRLSQAQREKLDAVEWNVSKSWTGSKVLRKALLVGHTNDDDDVLTKPLNDLAQLATAASEDASLLSALGETAKQQSQRVRRWQSMHEQIVASKQVAGSNGTEVQAEIAKLRFDKHRSLSLRDAPQTSASQPRQRSETNAIISKYDEILTAMREELRNNRRATAPTFSPTKHAVLPIRKSQPSPRNPSVHLDTMAGAPDLHQRSPSQKIAPLRPGINRRASSRSGSRSYNAPKVEGQRQPIPLKSEIFSPLKANRRSLSSPLSSSSMLATPAEDTSMADAPGLSVDARDPNGSRRVSGSSEANSAIDSGISIEMERAASEDRAKGNAGPESPSREPHVDVDNASDKEFRKPELPSSTAPSASRPSLAERTRMSMAFRSSEDVHGVLPEPLVSTPEEAAPAELLTHTASMRRAERRATLAERTRESISLAPAPPANKPSHARSRSSLYPVNQFDTPKKPRHSSIAAEHLDSEEPVVARRDITPREQLFSPEAEYDSVFRPRPKVKMSPISTPITSPSGKSSSGGKSVDARESLKGSPLVGRG